MHLQVNIVENQVVALKNMGIVKFYYQITEHQSQIYVIHVSSWKWSGFLCEKEPEKK
mgnify:CR=1 FL=1